MERTEMIGILNGMCERCLIKGMITTLDEAKTLCEVFDRFRNNNYKNDEEYSQDILYLYELAVKLHDGGHTSLGESYSIYNALLSADKIDFVEVDEDEYNDENDIIKIEPIKIKKTKKQKEDEGVVDISDITPIS